MFCRTACTPRSSKSTANSCKSTAISPSSLVRPPSFVWRGLALTFSPARYFLAKPEVGEEMHLSIEQGKTLIVKLLATGPVK